MPTRTTAHSAVTPSCGQADHRCWTGPPTVTDTTWFAASGRNRMRSKCQLSGSVCSRIGTMNISAITIAIVPAVCRTIEPTPNAISATIVTNSAVPMIAVSTSDAVITSVPEKVTVRWPQPGPAPGPLFLPPPGPMQFTIALAGIVTVWNSEAATPLPDSIAWPAKNAMNEVTSEITSVTDGNASALAA